MHKATLSLVAALMTLCAIEVGARIYDLLFPDPPDRSEFLRSTYMGLPYGNLDFGGEITALTRAIADAMEGNRILPPFSGKYFNIRDGMRATTGQPESYENTIHVFGGSTTFSSGVPDWFTIPSILQELVRKRFGDRYIVRNRGVPGATARNQTETLLSTDIRPGDIVLFYDGANEISHSIFEGGGLVELYDPRDIDPDTWTVAERVANSVWDKLHPYSQFVRRHLNLATEQRWTFPPHLRSQDTVDRLLEAAASEFRSALRAAAAYCRENQAFFVHFLQPTLFTQAEHTDHERKLISNHNLVFNGMQFAHERGYPVLRRVLRELEGEIRSFDLSNALSPRPDGHEHFLDDCHVLHGANAIVARRIFEALFESNLDLANVAHPD